MKRAHCTVKDIAKAAGVSLSTVSYALRNSRRVSTKTCVRIQSIAERLGYKRNPHVSALMAHIGRGRKIRVVENIGLIWPQTTRQYTKTVELCRDIVSGIHERANALGFGVEQFWIEEDGLSGARISKILDTRNIRGLICAPVFHGPSVVLGLDWEKFATVVLGHAQWTPELNRCMSNHYVAIRECLDRLVKMGSRCPAAIFSGDINLRTDFTQEAAFLTHHPDPTKARGMVFIANDDNLGEVASWLDAVKADGIIFGTTRAYDTCMALNKASLAKRQCVTLGWESGEERLPGIKFPHDLIAASAVDVLVSQLHRNQVGVPERPWVLSLRGDWMDARLA